MKLVTTKELRDSKEKTRLEDDSLVILSLDTSLKFDAETVEESREIDFTISSETVDSYNDIVKADGWDLERYLKNPVVLWAHDRRSRPPIGKARNVRAEDSLLKATAEFADAQTYDFADNVFRLLRSGFLNATSVGFLPLEWTWDEKRGGFNFIQQELFEFSVVPVPANPDALMNAVNSGEDLGFLKDWCEETLDCWRPDGHVAMWVPRQDVEAIHSLVSSHQVAVVEDTGDVGETVSDNSTSTGVTSLGGTYEPTITSDPYHEFWSPNTAPRDDGETGDSVSQVSSTTWVYNGIDEDLRQKVDDLTDLVKDLMGKVEMLLEQPEPEEINGDVEFVIDEQTLSQAIDDLRQAATEEVEEVEDKDDITVGLRNALEQMHETGRIEDEQEFRGLVKQAAERAIMKRTGKLPKEV